VRVIAATNRDLKQAVAAGAFREDLLYRLDVFSLRMPALRERPNDILAIAESQLRQLSSQAGKNIAGFSEAARHLLQRYAWPGNIRELRNAIERAIILCAGDVLDVTDFPATLTDGENSGMTPFLGGEYSTEEIEAEHIRQVLARKTSIQEAAQVLQMDRSTLLRKRKSLNL
jgi:two-component system, NtrC family, response regulator AlgB